MAGKTGLELYEQFELILTMDGVTDYNQWFIDNWGGYVKTQELIGYTPSANLRYKIWDNLTFLKGERATLMLLLTMPEDLQKYFGILTTTGNMLISDAHIHYKEPTDAQIEEFRKKFDVIGPCYGKYYGGTLNYVVNGEENLNKNLCVGYDSVSKYSKEEYKIHKGYNYAGNMDIGVEEAPMIKWIMEPLNTMYVRPGAGAVAATNGQNIYYGYSSGLSEFGIFTHENAHIQDKTYFFNNEGWKPGTGFEFYSSYFLTEPQAGTAGGRGDFTINKLSEFNLNFDNVAALSYERVNTAAELQDFYKDLFDSGYALDTIMGNAFIHSSINVQYKAGMKAVVEQSESNAKWNYTSFNYGPGEYELSVANINSFEKLYDNKIVYRSIDNFYTGSEPGLFWEVYWFTPSNPNGCSDAWTFKVIAHELLGEKGWDQGLVAWSSGRYPNDEAAIQAITGKSGMREYKLSRFAETQEKLSSIPYYDEQRIEEIFKTLYASQKRGSTDKGLALKEILIQPVKLATDDFSDGNMYTKPTANYYEISSASEFVRIVNENSMKKGLYIKLTGDLDFTNVVGTANYYGEHFVGIIDGSDYTMKGLTKPLFKSTKYAVLHDITFESTADTILIYKAADSSYSLGYDCNYGEGKTLFGSTGSDKCMYEYFINVPEVEPEVEPEVTPTSVAIDFQSVSLQNAVEKLTEKAQEESEESEIISEEIQETESREVQEEAYEEAEEVISKEVQEAESQEEAYEEAEKVISKEVQEENLGESKEEASGE